MSASLEDVQDRILDRIHAGEALDREALLAEHPEHAEALRAFFQVLDVVEGRPDEDGLAPATLGEFRILREIGRGGMGVVYEARQESLDRRVALKVLPPTLRMDARLVTRFHREAQAAGRLRHPGIVPVFSVGEASGTPFFAMELVEGTSLQEVLRARRAGEDAGLPVAPDAWRRWAVETVAKVADALAYAHAQGILHRDVKPANVLLDASGAPRLTDFGLARDLRAAGLSQTGEVFGSPQYMSPEQAVRCEAPVDERTDVYSLAVTLYELLTLELPYEAATHAELFTALATGRVVPPRKVDPTLPRALEQVLLRALRRDPAERYGGAVQFAADLRAALAGERIARSPSSRRRVAAVAAVLLLALGALAVVLAPGTRKAADPARREAAGPGDGAAQGASRPGAPVPPAAGPPAAGSVEAILADYRAAPPRTLADYRATIDALLAIDGESARLALREVYRDFVAGPGRDDKAARAALGYAEFTHEVPEDIAYRDYPYIRAVEAASRRRWFAPQEADFYRLALEAWLQTQEHRRRLIEDRHFRAVDAARATLTHDPRLRGRRLLFRWAEPFLVGYVAKDLLSVYELLADGDVRGWAERLPAIEARRRRAEAILDEKARLFTQVHHAYLERYRDRLRLKPLTDEYGGRADYPLGVRSFQDGCPLVVLVFDSAKTWGEYTGPTESPWERREPGGFDPRTGRVHLVVEATEDAKLRASQLDGEAAEAVRLLQFWFARQRNHWRKPWPSQAWSDSGIAEYLGSVRMAQDGTLTFTGVNAQRLRDMQELGRRLTRLGTDYEVFPLARLAAFTSHGEVQAWGVQTWQLAPEVVLAMFLQQSWALARFLNEAGDGAWRERFERFYDLVLHEETGFTKGSQAFEEAFRVRDEEDWSALDVAFGAYVREQLMNLDPAAYAYEPPALGAFEAR